MGAALPVSPLMAAGVLFVRAAVGVLAGTVLLDAVFGIFAPSVRHPLLGTVRRVSVRVAEPVRIFMPGRLQTGRLDIAPLVAVLLMLLVGFGFESFLDILWQ